MPEEPSEPAPFAARFDHLGAAGRELVNAVLDDLAEVDLDPDSREVALLVQAGELRDRQAVIADSVAELGEVLISDSGVVKVHPGVAEARQHAVAIARVLSGLQLAADAPKDATKQRAARARWGR